MSESNLSRKVRMTAILFYTIFASSFAGYVYFFYGDPAPAWLLLAHIFDYLGLGHVGLTKYDIAARDIVGRLHIINPFLQRALIVSGVITITSLLLILAFSVWRRARTGQERGATLKRITPKRRLFTSRAVADLELQIGGIVVPRELEPLSFGFFGSPGSGKSLAIAGMQKTIRARKEIAIVADAGGEGLSQFFEPQDLILCPLDSRSVDWSPFAEIDHAWDIDQLSKSIVPDRPGAGAEWATYAQQVIAAVMKHCWSAGGQAATTGYLLHLLTVEAEDTLSAIAQGGPAGRLFDPANAKFRASVMAIVAMAVSPWQYLNPASGAGAFSIKKWIKSAPKGWLWIPYQDGQQAALAPLLTCWFDITSQALLSLPTELDRRAWLILDEFASLGKIPALPKLLTKGRKKGVSAVAGIQTISQVHQAWGREGAQEILACLQNWVALRSVDAETAGYLEKQTGKRQFERQEKSHSHKTDLLADSGTKSIANRTVTESLVLASEYQNLPSRAGYLCLAGDYPIVKVEIPIIQLPQVAAPFISADPRPRQSIVQQLKTPAAPVRDVPDPTI